MTGIAMMHLKLRIASICLLVLMSARLVAQDEPKETGDSVRYSKVTITNADYARGETIDAVEYTFLKGNIELSQDSIFMQCDSAVIKDEMDVYAYGNVIIQKGDSLTIFADTLRYFGDSLHAELEGEVILLHNEEIMRTSRLDYDLANDIAYYYREAVMINDSVQISSRRGYFYTRSSQARFIDSVVVISDQVILLADSLDYNTESQLAGFLGPTLILQNASRIYCEDGFYNVRGEEAEFRENAEYRDGAKIATADTIRYEGATGAVFLKGNAHYEENDKVIDAREILFFEETGETRVIGNAVFRDSTRYAEADTILYNRNSENLSTVGRSKVIEGPQTLIANTIDFDQKTGYGIAKGDVYFQDTSSNVIILCDTAELQKETEFVKAYGLTRPMMKTLMDEDTLYLTADTLQFARVLDTIYHYEVDTVWNSTSDSSETAIKIEQEVGDSLQVDSLGTDTLAVDPFVLDTTTTFTVDSFRRFNGFMDVRLFKGTLQGLCDSLAFETSDSLFRMIGSPILWSDTTQLTGDTITMAMKNETIDHVNLIDDAMIVSEVRGIFYNQIKGKRMKARMVEGELSDLRVRGNAQSVYYAMDDTGAFIGVYDVVASEIYFTFARKQLSGIRLYSQSDGVMTPMKDVNHNEKRLEGFSWQHDRRPKTLDDLF